MIKNNKQPAQRKKGPDRAPLPFLILAVTVVLITLILTTSHAQGTILAITIVLIVLILAVTGTPELLPGILRTILAEIARLMRM